ncbi:MAG: cell division protein FtsQ/DivIB [Flavobacteriales bacterium]|jgi:cell division protein FtsQ|nr:cell division protein FtsQ/DivIB [Flavobacteriales bacterium]
MTKNKNIIKWLRISYWLLILLLFGYILFWSNIQKTKNPVVWKETTVNVVNEESVSFIQAQSINGIFEEKNLSYINTPVRKIDQDTLEKIIEQNPFIQKAEIYTDFHGEMNIEVIQEVPYLRVHRPQKSYYLNQWGENFPLSSDYTARVPIIRVDIDSFKNDQILDLFHTLESKPLVRKQIAEVYINSFEEITLVPRMGKFLVELGPNEDIPEKLDNFEHTMNLILKTKGWNRYSKISLAFKNQVVCTKIKES